MFKITVLNAFTMLPVFTLFRFLECDAEKVANAWHDPEGEKFHRCYVATWEKV